MNEERRSSSQSRQPLDYEKARKKRQRAYKRKQIFLVLFLILLVGGVLYVNDFLVQKSVTVQIDDFFDTMGGTGFPVRLPGGIIQTTDSLGKNLVVMNDTNLYVYTPNGKRILNVQQVSDRSIIETNNDRILLYHPGDLKFSVYSATGALHTQELEDAIFLADIGKGGDVVAVTAARQFRANIIIYASDFSHRMTRRVTSDQQITTVAISPKGETFLVGGLTTQNGVLESSITIYMTGSGEEIASFTLPEQLLLNIEFQNELSFSVLTDTQYGVYSLVNDQERQSTGAYHLPAGYTLKGFESNGSETLLFYKDNNSSAEETVLLGSKAELLGLLPANDTMKDLVLSDQYLYVLESGGLRRYSFSMEEIDFTVLQGVTHLERVKDRVYLFTKTDIRVLGED